MAKLGKDLVGVLAALRRPRPDRTRRPGPSVRDVLDPAFAPGTGTPEVGGLTTIEGQALIRQCRGVQLVGADVVEVAPPFDPSGNTALVAATMMYELLCLLAEARGLND